MPPQFGRAAAQFVVPSFEVVEIESQYGLPGSLEGRMPVMVRLKAVIFRLKPEATKKEKREHDDGY